MTLSIDGVVHKTNFEVEYGEEFPKPNSNREVIHPYYGVCLVYILKTYQPKWTSRMTVNVPVEYWITQINEPAEKYLRDRKRMKLGLKVVEG